MTQNMERTRTEWRMGREPAGTSVLMIRPKFRVSDKQSIPLYTGAARTNFVYPALSTRYGVKVSQSSS